MKEVITYTSQGSGFGAWFLASVLWTLGMAAAIAAIRLALRADALRRAMLLCVGAAAVSLAGLSLRVSHHATKSISNGDSSAAGIVSTWQLESRPFFYVTATLALTALLLVLSKWLRQPDRPVLLPTGNAG